MTNGALFGVPIPREHETICRTIEEAVEQAVAEADENGVSKSGKEATPWLLRRVEELTSGGSLTSSEYHYMLQVCSKSYSMVTSDIALIQNTALVGEPRLYIVCILFSILTAS
jgi:pseudouridine-5'-phosphate glycosidase